jgi:hypothetical protein
MLEKNEIKWYNDPQMVGGLMLFWPPLGIYGLYRSETIERKCKLVVYGVLVLVCILWALTLLS